MGRGSKMWGSGVHGSDRRQAGPKLIHHGTYKVKKSQRVQGAVVVDEQAEAY